MKFVIKKTESTGQYSFRIVASNGQILAHSEQYVDKRSAQQAIDSIKSHAAGATTEDES